MTTDRQRIYVTWQRTTDGAEHAVTDEEATRARQDGTGRPLGVCGEVVLAVSLCSPPGQKCPRCLCVLLARRTLSDMDIGPRVRCRRELPVGFRWLRRIFRRPDRLARTSQGPHHGGPAATLAPAGPPCSTTSEGGSGR